MELLASERRRTLSGKSYTVETWRVRVDMPSALSIAFRPDDTLRACMACPNYDRVWTCPPFVGGTVDTNPANYDVLDLYIARIRPEGGPYRLDGYDEFFHPEKIRLMSCIDRLGSAGAVYSFAGRCDWCAGECARANKKPCRHPDKAHPSLEGIGFDVNALLLGFTDFSIEWGTNGFLPSTLTFVAGVANHRQ